MRAAKRLPAPEHDIKTPAPAVPRMRSADRGNARGVAGHGQPVVHRGADLASLDRRLTRPVVAGDEKDEPVACIFRPLEGKVDRPPCAVESVAVQVDDAVGLDRTGA